MTRRSGTVALAGIAALLAAAAAAEPLDLDDPTPRWVEVSFEVSPRSEPGRLDARYTPPIPAWLQPAGRPGWRVVAVPAELVERHLLRGQDPVPGSFSDFVWVFDAESGHVVWAELRGVVYTRLDWGLFRSRARAEIEVELSTERSAGFRRARRFLGQLIHHYCEPDEPGECSVVPAVPYRRQNGYVNAVGEIVASSAGISTRAFSPLGEARFAERAAPPWLVPAVAAGPPR